MGKIYETIIEHLKDKKCDFNTPKDGVIEIGARQENASYRVFLVAKEQEEQFAAYVIAPNAASEKKRGAVAEFITRANYGLGLGNFEIDLADGEIRFKVSTRVRESKVSKAMCEDMISIGVTTMDKHYPGIMSVAYADIAPVDAVNRVRGAAASADNRTKPTRPIGF